MSNPNKKWSLGAALGRAAGSALGSGGAGFVAGSIAGQIGAPLAALIGAGGGLVGGFTGAVLGYWWDAPPDEPESPSSALLYCSIVVGTLCSILYAIILPMVTVVRLDPFIAEKGFAGFAILAGFLGSASRSLIDDLRAAARRETRTPNLPTGPLPSPESTPVQSQSAVTERIQPPGSTAT
jgi:hypothetical protein